MPVTRGTACRRLAAQIDFERASKAAPDGLALPRVNVFEDLRVLPVQVWVDDEHIRRVHFTNGRPEAQQILTLDLWDFGVSTADLDWSRLPTFNSAEKRTPEKE